MHHLHWGRSRYLLLTFSVQEWEASKALETPIPWERAGGLAIQDSAEAKNKARLHILMMRFASLLSLCLVAQNEVSVPCGRHLLTKFVFLDVCAVMAERAWAFPRKDLLYKPLPDSTLRPIETKSSPWASVFSLPGSILFWLLSVPQIFIGTLEKVLKRHKSSWLKSLNWLDHDLCDSEPSLNFSEKSLFLFIQRWFDCSSTRAPWNFRWISSMVCWLSCTLQAYL
jgi:hypothetical protein